MEAVGMEAKHYSFAFPVRIFPAGQRIKTTDLWITSAACLNFFFSLPPPPSFFPALQWPS